MGPDEAAMWDGQQTGSASGSISPLVKRLHRLLAPHTVHEDRLCCHKAGYLPGGGPSRPLWTHHKSINREARPIDSDRLNNALTVGGAGPSQPPVTRRGSAERK